jgi:xanthine dehydrogenase small subunit
VHASNAQCALAALRSTTIALCYREHTISVLRRAGRIHRLVQKMSDSIRFLLNEKRIDVARVSPQTTLLEFLRDDQRLTGTKEGCAEGDCGACTVVLAERCDGALAWKPINACIRLLPSVDGKAVFTVESLAPGTGKLHPVQQSLVDWHASQCGFCTPGFAMSLFGLYKAARAPSRSDIDDALSGNLCRCTGYRPIIDAAHQMYALAPLQGWRGPGIADDGTRVTSDDEKRLAASLGILGRDRALEYACDGQRWSAPRTAAEVAQACSARPDARIVGGMTDVALWVTKQHRVLDDVIYVGDADDLRAIREPSGGGLEIGAAVSLGDAVTALNRSWPELTEIWQRFASVPIRNSATLVGNIANGSPIGDSMPALIGLDALVVLRHGNDERIVPLDAFYPGFRQTARKPGEFVSAVRVPARSPALVLRAYKISKRFDQDISAVFACFALTLHEGRIRSARIGCGGVAATPVRARNTEAALEGAPWNLDTAERAAFVLSAEFTPIDDMRASANYRRVVLGNLLRRLAHETAGVSTAPTRVESPAVLGP